MLKGIKDDVDRILHVKINMSSPHYYKYKYYAKSEKVGSFPVIMNIKEFWIYI